MIDGGRPSVETLLQNPSYFLTGLDMVGHALSFVPAERDVLSAEAFVDRSQALNRPGAGYSIPLSDAESWAEGRNQSAGPSCFMFHMSFCGSTLLARACDVAGKAMAYKEPQALIDLVSSLVQGVRAQQGEGWFYKVRDIVLDQFFQPWAGEERCFIKPSNWVNGYLPDLVRRRVDPRVVLVTIDPRDFLVAVLRGGRERIDYVCRLVVELQKAMPGYDTLVSSAVDQSQGPFLNVARLILVAHHIQREAFDALLAEVPGVDACRVDFQQVTKSPEASVALVSETFGLGLTSADIEANVASVYRYCAKSQGVMFDAGKMSDANTAVLDQYQYVIEPALAWYAALEAPERRLSEA